MALLAFTPVTLRLALPFTQPAARLQRASGSFGLLRMAFTVWLSLWHERQFIATFLSDYGQVQQLSFLLYLPLHIQARWARWRRWTRWARAPSTV